MRAACTNGAPMNADVPVAGGKDGCYSSFRLDDPGDEITD
jgi:hypothetical protein